MDTSKYSRKISLKCSSCNSTKFEFDEQDEHKNRLVKCKQCGKETTEQVLLAENSKNISGQVEEIKKQVVVDFQKELSKKIKNIFK